MLKDNLDDLEDAPTAVAPPDPRLAAAPATTLGGIGYRHDLPDPTDRLDQPDQPDPIAAAPLPLMTRTEASLHASVADARAVQAHRQGTGAQAELAEQGATALIEHAGRDGGPVAAFGGIGFHRPNAYSVYAVSGMDKLFADAADLYPLDHTGLLLYAFFDPQRAHDRACILKDAPGLLAKARDLILRLEYPEHIEAAKEWCQEQFALLNGVKKPSPAVAPPAVATTTASANSPGITGQRPATTPDLGSASSPTP